MKVKVCDLSKKLGVTNDAILRRCAELGISDVTHFNHTLSEDDTLTVEAVINGEVKAKTNTKPWNASDNPWSLDMLRVQGMARPGFRLRWTTAHGLQRKLEQGWQLADRKNYGGVTDTIVGEESKSGSMIKRRELILIEISDDLAKARDDFFRAKTDKRSVDAKKIATDQAAKLPGTDLKVSSTVA